MASSNTAIPDDQSTASLTLEDLAMGVRSLIAEAERFVLQERGTLLPPGWTDKIYSMIDEAEAHIQIEQASHISECEHHRLQVSRDSTEAWWRSSKQVCYSSTEAVCQGTALADERRKSGDSAVSAELSNHHVYIEQQIFALSHPDTSLEDLQGDVYALLAIISMHMADFRSLKQRQTSELAWFSILEEESAILIELNNQIEDLYEPPHGMGEKICHEVLQDRFDGLPVQLQAVFNMQCHERESQGGEIADDEMMQMVLENQKRTDMLRKIQTVLDKEQDILCKMGRE
ncbi:hypothetical protein VMCG_04760 [Cytospora schulzeri]|uniref:Uncharacterized protein n=1 Tax=Cytospora schulzeri TaxID=448051 RepID=A0A423WN70_9PEZI|nr:hypothetical protein VMCG_04760 [Valsa malicola]